MGLLGKTVSIRHVELDAHGHAPFRDVLDELYSSDCGDLVFSMCAGDGFGRAETAKLKGPLGDRLRTFTNVRFDGLHPDMTYFGGYRQRYPGAFGEYHSKIALFSYVTGRSPRECAALFTGQIFERLGYMDRYAESATELLDRDRNCDIKFGAAFLDMVRTTPVLHTFNHPTTTVLAELSCTLLDAANIPRHECEPSMVASHLSATATWPVFDAIAEHHGLAYRTPQVIFAARDDQHLISRGVPIEDAVVAMYSGYDRLDPIVMREDLQAQPYYARFCEALG